MKIKAIGALGLAFLVSDLSRTVNGVLGDSMRSDMSLSEASLGVITASFYIAFLLFQLPFGVLLDKVGPRKLQLFLLPIASIGAILCYLATDFSMLFLGRLLLGVGMSACLMAAFKGVSEWVPLRKVPMGNGLILGGGAIGGILATTPAAALSENFGWALSYLVLAIFICVAWSAIWISVPARSGAKAPPFKVSSLILAARDPIFRTVAVPAALSLGVASSFQGLWAGIWFSESLGMSSHSVGLGLFWMSISTIVGSLFIGFVANRLSNFGASLESVTYGFLLLHIAIQSYIVVFNPNGVVSWTLFSFFGVSGMLVFSCIATNNPGDNVAFKNAIFNLLSFGMAALIQVLYGALLDYALVEDAADVGERHSWALGLLVVVQLLVVITALIIGKVLNRNSILLSKHNGSSGC
ncbi:MAG: MFS transporter [Burkholderiaceae bacterium]